MSLNAAAQHLADYGRHGDTTLVHMTPDEVRGLQQLAQAHGTSLTINPHTGLPEAFSLKQLVKVAAPIALGAFLGPAGAAYGGGFFSAAGAGMAVGGFETLRTGSLEKGLMAGLSAYGAADMSTAAVDAAAKEEAAKQIATQESYVANELAAQKAAETGATSGAVQASATPGIQGAQTADLANEANMLTTGTEGQLANANAYNAQIDPIGRIASTYSTPTSGIETLMNNPDAVAKQMGGYGSMARSGLMAAAPILTMPPEGPDAPPIPERYITPKYYDYRTQTYVDLPSVNTKDWGDKTIEGYRNSMVAKPVRAAADGGMMGAVNPYSDEALAYRSEPVVRMANGGVARFAGGGVSDEEIKAYVSAHMDDPAAIAAAAQQHGVSMADLSRATGFSGEQVGGYFSNAGIDFGGSPAAPQTAAPAGITSAGPTGIASAAPTPAAAPSQVDVNTSVKNWIRDNPNATYQQMRDAASGAGISDAMLLGAYDTLGFSAADKNVTFNKDWTNAKGMTGYQGLNDNITSWLANNPTATKADALQAMLDSGLNNADVFRATGKTLSQLFDENKAKVTPTPTPAPTPGGSSTTGGGRTTDTYTGGTTTTPKTYAPEGTTNPYGNYINPGDITTNADDTRTVTPNIPGRPYGGFTGAGQLRDAYTAGGGNLGQTLAPTKSYTNTGGSADAYGYLFGERAWPTQQQRQPVYKDTVGNTTQKYVWKDGLLVLNPDYVDPLAKKEDVVEETPVNNTGEGANGGLMAAYASGGQTQYNLGGYSDGGRLLRGPGDGVSDSIPATIGGKQPARLADGEFVIPARIVSEIGNGSTEAGARKLYAMMDRVQKARGKTVGKGKVAKNTRADKHLPA